MENLADKLGLDNEQMAAILTLGDQLFRQGRLEEAKKVFEGLAALDETNPYFFAMLGAISQQCRNFEDAVNWYTRALNIFSQDVHALTNRGESYLNLQKLPQAAADFQGAIRLDQDGNNPAGSRARLLVEMTRQALALAAEKGAEGVLEAKRLIDEELAR